jgi:hypothetical protein
MPSPRMICRAEILQLARLSHGVFAVAGDTGEFHSGFGIDDPP